MNDDTDPRPTVSWILLGYLLAGFSGALVGAVVGAVLVAWWLAR